MDARVATSLQLLDHDPMSVRLVADLTGVPPGTIEDDLMYLERLGVVEETDG